MIRYALQCQAGHRFEAWFRSADSFDAQKAAGQLSCAICGDSAVDRALMAPDVSSKTSRQPEAAPGAPPAPLEALRRYVEANSVDVGTRFPEEARAIHDGTATPRAIRGEATMEQAKSLIEDGVPIAPLPFIPTRKTN